MRSSKTTVDRQGREVPKVLCILACAVALGMGATSIPASAMNIGAARSLAEQAIAGQSNPDVIEIRGGRGGGGVARGGRVAVGPRGGAVARGGRVAVGPRGGVAVRRTTVVRPGYHGGGVRWTRPGRYYWPRGGAIAAGAAIGFATAATAAAWAGAAPAPGMCWYYTDPSRTQGFWDYCP
jgi:hypothetical protein